MRTCENKPDSLLMDHAGNAFHRFGWPDDKRVFTLDDAPKCAPSDDRGPTISRCKICIRTFRYGPTRCPFCGAELERNKREIKVEAGELQEMVKEKRLLTPEQWQAKLARDEERRAKYLEVCQTGYQREYKDGWASIRFKEMFHTWPPREWIQAAETMGFRAPKSQQLALTT